MINQIICLCLQSKKMETRRKFRNAHVNIDDGIARTNTGKQRKVKWICVCAFTLRGGVVDGCWQSMEGGKLGHAVLADRGSRERGAIVKFSALSIGQHVLDPWPCRCLVIGW